MKVKLMGRWRDEWLWWSSRCSLNDWRRGWYITIKHLYRLFWNQMRICLSVSWISSASSMRSSRVRNDCLTNLSSIASSWVRLNTVLPLLLLLLLLLLWQRAPDTRRRLAGALSSVVQLMRVSVLSWRAGGVLDIAARLQMHIQLIFVIQW